MIEKRTCDSEYRVSCTTTQPDCLSHDQVITRKTNAKTFTEIGKYQPFLLLFLKAIILDLFFPFIWSSKEKQNLYHELKCD